MGDFHHIVSTLKSNLKKELPGFEAQKKMAPSFRGEFPFRSNKNLTPRNSAVLICIYPNEGKATTILIKRTTYNGAHSGQVSFPGGKQEGNDESLIETALRETREEVGISEKLVRVLGVLTPLHIPVSNMVVLPVIGVLEQQPEIHLNLQEVEYPIFVGLECFKDNRFKSVKILKVNNVPISAPFYSVEGEFVWGATAMIISELTEVF